MTPTTRYHRTLLVPYLDVHKIAGQAPQVDDGARSPVSQAATPCKRTLGAIAKKPE